MTCSFTKYGKEFTVDRIPKEITEKCFEIIGKDNFSKYIYGHLNAGFEAGFDYAKKKYIALIPITAIGSLFMELVINDLVKFIRYRIEEKE